MGQRRVDESRLSWTVHVGLVSRALSYNAVTESVLVTAVVAEMEEAAVVAVLARRTAELRVVSAVAVVQARHDARAAGDTVDVQAADPWAWLERGMVCWRAFLVRVASHGGSRDLVLRRFWGMTSSCRSSWVCG